MVAVLREIVCLCVGEQDEVLQRSWMCSQSMHQSRSERGHCATPKRLAKYGSGSAKNQNSTFRILQTTSSFNVPQIVRQPERDRGGDTSAPLASPTVTVTTH